MTFDDISTEPEQEFELCVDTNGIHEYSLKYIYLIMSKHYIKCKV